jgi:hypothetical protein
MKTVEIISIHNPADGSNDAVFKEFWIAKTILQVSGEAAGVH